MNYRKDKYGNKLSQLGFGCMRFPAKAGRIDMAETELKNAAEILEFPLYEIVKKGISLFKIY